MEAPALKPPFPVSPLIKLSRWTLLVAGIAWGMHRHRVNKRKEDEYQAYLDKMKPIWYENKRKILENKNREVLLATAKELGITPKPDFDKLYPYHPDAPEKVRDIPLH